MMFPKILQIKLEKIIISVFLLSCNFLICQIRVNQDSLSQIDGKYSFQGNLFTGGVYVLSDNHQLKNEFQVINGFISGQSVFYIKKEHFDKNKFVDTILVQKYQNQINLLSQEINDFKKDSIELKTSSDDLFNNKIGGLDKFYDLEEKNNKGKLKGEKKENYDNYFSFKNRIEENKKKLLSKRTEFSSVNLKLSQEKGKNIFENTKSELITYKDNNKNGLYEKYEKSKLIESGKYSNNKKNGEWKTYDSYGKLNLMVTYKNDILDGGYKKYSGANIIEEGNYISGLMNGEWIFRTENGNLKAKGNFVNGEGLNKDNLGVPIIGRSGDWIIYHNNGTKAQECSYRNGELEGLFISFKENGEKNLECNYVKGQKQGLFTSNYVYKCTGKYLNDSINGEMVCYYPSGKVYDKTNYKNGIQNGNFTTFHENGKEKYKFIFINGKSEGVFTSFYENGNKKREGYDKNGTDEYEGSIVANYNEDGTLKQKWEYKNGEWTKYLTPEEADKRLKELYEESNKIVTCSWCGKEFKYGNGYKGGVYKYYNHTCVCNSLGIGGYFCSPKCSIEWCEH